MKRSLREERFAFFSLGTASVLTIRKLAVGLERTGLELSQTAQQVASAAEQVSISSQSLVQGASEQASALEETSASTGGKDKVDQTARAIHTISGQSTQMRMLADEVNLGSQEQAHGIEQIAKAMSQMEQVTQTTAESAEQSAAAERLSVQSATMMDIAKQLKQLVDGGSLAH